MGTVVLPKLNQTGTNEWADVEDNDKALRDEFNGNIENVNIKSTAAIAHSKLADATAGYTLRANGSGVITASSVPVCVLAQTSSVASGNSSAETWAGEWADTDGMHSTSVNTSRITIQTAGIYRIQASVWFDHTLNAGEHAFAFLSSNGTNLGGRVHEVVNVYWAYADLDYVFPCTASTYFEATFSHNNAGSKSATKRFTATYIGPS